MDEVWIFHAVGGQFAGGAFRSRHEAESWIAKYSLSGVLTAYPVGIGVYDWAIARGTFTPKTPRHQEPSFIGGFSSAYQTHLHYDEGRTGTDRAPGID